MFIITENLKELTTNQRSVFIKISTNSVDGFFNWLIEGGREGGGSGRVELLISHFRKFI